MPSDDKDSLTRLVCDVKNATAAADLRACAYFGKSEDDGCDGCPAYGDDGPCVESVIDDVARRLHALMPHDKDGREVRVGDTIHRVGTGMYHEVCGLAAKVVDVGGYAIACDLDDYRVVERDSWQRLVDDATKSPSEYLGDRDMTIPIDEADDEFYKSVDLVRRAKALAGVE